ncbi:hypothetical protein ATY41_02975 [Leifsonia xyli subsp. xyli]|uniref:Uncharacterized protein n=1 Tax=Leifsonia xyli subsp. xyli TaxID=59736 RepID=A0A1E2SJT8_LEIXY|nr:hypothetical protein [Leifsonia xyli]ODA90017.1 hypothetical protein ATY41_02975 [Leifsonia xyli subsp. xyli]
MAEIDGRRLRRLWVAAALAVPAGAGLLAGAVLALLARPEWQSWQTPFTIVRFLAPPAAIGGLVAAIAAVGAVVAVTLTRRTAPPPPSAAAGGSAIAIAVMAVIMLSESTVGAVFVLPFAAFAALVAAPLALVAARLALREKSATSPEHPSPIQS